MAWSERLVLLLCLRWILCDEQSCVIELQCAECLPANMPLVTSHRAANGSLAAAAGDEVTFSCGAGRLLAYPQLAALTARCEAGRYRAPDGRLRHLLELGCQESVFEDVLHAVEHCAPPQQGRAYRLRQSDRSARHLATLCYDADRALAVIAHAASAPRDPLRLGPHAAGRAPLTLLGNFNHLFDLSTRHRAERLYGDPAAATRRLRELLRPERVALTGQALATARLLHASYFEEQDARVADFPSNAVATWASVAAGNLRHLQRDVAELLRAARPNVTLDVYAGTHGVAALRAERARLELFLEAERFPVPKYVWTVVVARKSRRALAVAVLNDPFVAVSEIREAVFCESACSRAGWLRALRRLRNYETPLLGLTFCCEVHEFAAVVRELPAALVADVPRGPNGLLLDLDTDLINQERTFESPSV